ncbi:hypothetical protein MRB53_032627 [Persea americana]|uniref:Uncharacterized protein n=1 Tax=Persea americana TaxID=3435 RepID=A0ACC2KSR0_PERAE|nr:hypothetical protein MRB53_032627 [Persea americana]
MADEEPKPLTYIPETVLKKRKSNEEWAIKKRERLEARRQSFKEDRKLIFKRAEQFIKEFRDKELDLVRMNRRTKLKRPLHINPEAKLLFAIHIGGYPNLKSVKELVYKKGFGKVDKQKVPLTDNNIIEQALGKHNVICIEDILHEVSTVGSHFKEVVDFLWPFRLNKPDGALQRKKQQFKDGGDSGNREDQINELISKMNWS